MKVTPQDTKFTLYRPCMPLSREGKDVKAVYLDEPEQGLSEYEMSILCTLIQYFSRFFEEIIIVTHSELFVQMVNCRYFTVVMDEKTADVELIQVSEDDKFEIID